MSCPWQPPTTCQPGACDGEPAASAGRKPVSEPDGESETDPPTNAKWYSGGLAQRIPKQQYNPQANEGSENETAHDHDRAVRMMGGSRRGGRCVVDRPAEPAFDHTHDAGSDAEQKPSPTPWMRR